MDLAFSEEQQTWFDDAARFAAAELGDSEDEGHSLRERDERREFWREGWRRCARFGIQGLPVPAEFGGKGASLPTADRRDGGPGLRLPRQRPDLRDQRLALDRSRSRSSRYGTEDQKPRYLPGLCDGTLVGANGASEPEAGSDIFSMHDPRRAARRSLGARTAARPGSPAARSPTSSSATPRPTRPRGSWASRRSSSLATRPASASSARSTSWACGPCRWASSPSRTVALPADEPARPRGTRGRGLQLLDGVGARRDPRQRPRHDAPAARTVHRATPAPASSSASRSASSSRSPTGSST